MLRSHDEKMPQKSIFKKIKQVFEKKLTKEEILKQNSEIIRKEREKNAQGRKNEVSFKDFEVDPGRALDWGKRQFGAWQKTCDREVIVRYSSSDGRFMELNAELRRGSENKIPEELKLFSERLDKTLRQARVPENIIVRRGLMFNDILAQYLGNTKENEHVDEFIRQNLREGSILRDLGFFSTTLNRDVANNYTYQYQLKIKVPKDMPGAFIEAVSGSRGNSSATPGEFEMLFPRDTKLKVTKVNEFPNKKYTIECEMQMI